MSRAVPPNASLLCLLQLRTSVVRLLSVAQICFREGETLSYRMLLARLGAELVGVSQLWL